MSVLSKLQARIDNLVGRGREICPEFLFTADGVLHSCKRCGYSCDVHLVRDALVALRKPPAETEGLSLVIARLRESARTNWRAKRFEITQEDAAALLNAFSTSETRETPTETKTAHYPCGCSRQFCPTHAPSYLPFDPPCIHRTGCTKPKRCGEAGYCTSLDPVAGERDHP